MNVEVTNVEGVENDWSVSIFDQDTDLLQRQRMIDTHAKYFGQGGR